ncbi:MAG: hypothetical protein ACT4ON_08765 [Bacteroidota bacterium]
MKYIALCVFVLFISCTENHNLSQNFSCEEFEIKYPDGWKIVLETPDTENTYLTAYLLYNPQLKVPSGTYKRDSLITIEPLFIGPQDMSDVNLLLKMTMSKKMLSEIQYVNSVPYVFLGEKDRTISWATVRQGGKGMYFIEFSIEKTSKNIISENLITSIIATIKVK